MNFDVRHIVINDEVYDNIMTWWNEYTNIDGALLWYLSAVVSSLMPVRNANKATPISRIIIFGDTSVVTKDNWGLIITNVALYLRDNYSADKIISTSVIANALTDSHLAFTNMKGVG